MLWPFNKQEIIKDTSKYRANTFGFYSFNGKSVVDFQDHLRKENVIAFIRKIWDMNPEREIIILDKFRSHHSKAVAETAAMLNIRLIFLPQYSPDLNPLEFIWKSIKRVVSIAPIDSEEKLKERIKESFLELSCRLKLAKRWTVKFLDTSIIV